MIIAQGAESIIERDGERIFKKRVPKSYRHPELDTKLSLSRLRREYKVLGKIRDLGIRVPDAELDEKNTTLILEFIDGKRLRDVLQETVAIDKMKKLGLWIATLHNNSIIHGDLTTSNVLVDNTGELVLIDFGLSLFSDRAEDKAVDIHLLEQALESTHHEAKEELFSAFLSGYSAVDDHATILARLVIVRSRGRNKH